MILLVAGCAGPTTPRAPIKTRREPVPAPARVQPDEAPPREPAPRRPLAGTAFERTTVELLGPIALSKDGLRLVALSYRGLVTTQWNVEDGTMVADDEGPMLAPTATAEGLVAIDDHFLARFSSDESARGNEIVIFKPGEAVKWRSPGVWGSVSPDAKTLALCIAKWVDSDPPSGIRLYRWPDLVLERMLLSELSATAVFAPGVNRLFEGEHVGRLTAWDTTSGKRTRMLDAEESINAAILTLDISPDGSMLLVGATPYFDGRSNGPFGFSLLQLWSTETLRPLKDWQDVKSVAFAAFLDDATFVYTTGYSRRAIVLARDPVTSKWSERSSFEPWNPNHVALDRTRHVLYGASGSRIRCLDLRARGHCPEPG